MAPDRKTLDSGSADKGPTHFAWPVSCFQQLKSVIRCGRRLDQLQKVDDAVEDCFPEAQVGEARLDDTRGPGGGSCGHR